MTEIKKTIKVGSRKLDFRMEMFDSPSEVIQCTNDRRITSRYSHENYRERLRDGFHGVSNWNQVVELMDKGYQDTVDKLNLRPVDIRADKKFKKSELSVAGYMPVVPLVLQGIPTCMLAQKKSPVRTKVINVIYDMAVTCGVDKNDLEQIGRGILGALFELEAQGYRFNLYVTQNYFNDGIGGDVLAVKIKSSSTPLNIKKMSFALTHPAFFRALGFDWRTRYPNGRYMYGLGSAMAHSHSDAQVTAMFQELMGTKAMFFSAQSLYNKAGHASFEKYRDLVKKGLEDVDKVVIE